MMSPKAQMSTVSLIDKIIMAHSNERQKPNLCFLNVFLEDLPTPVSSTLESLWKHHPSFQHKLSSLVLVPCQMCLWLPTSLTLFKY